MGRPGEQCSGVRNSGQCLLLSNGAQLRWLLGRRRPWPPTSQRYPRSSIGPRPCPRLPGCPSLRADPMGCGLSGRTYFVTIIFVVFVTVFGFFTFVVARGVTATVIEHVPTASAFTVVFTTEHLLFEDFATFRTTVAPFGTEIFADLLIVAKEIFFPFFTVGVFAFGIVVVVTIGIVVVVSAGTVVVVTTGTVVATAGTVVVTTAAGFGVTALEAADVLEEPPSFLAKLTNV